VRARGLRPQPGQDQRPGQLTRPGRRRACHRPRPNSALRLFQVEVATPIPRLASLAQDRWPLRGSTTSRSAIADRRHPSGGHRRLAAPFGSSWDEASATAAAWIRPPYSCWLQRQAQAPCSPQRTRHLRPLPGTSSTLHGAHALHTHMDNILSIGEMQAPMHCLRPRSRHRPRWIPGWGALPIPQLAAARSRLSPCPDSRPRRARSPATNHTGSVHLPGAARDPAMEP
jgi:hypothetical protein